MATVTFRHLQKQYGATRVLDDVDMDVADGEYVVIVGPSGCGKSTLLRCIAGLELISSGELLIDGRRVNDVAPRDRNVAMVFQSYALYPHMTVRENMGFALRIQKQSPEEIARAVDGAAAMLELTPLLDRYPAQLSGGQRQRVAMGRAIVRRPGVFLFDEPLSNLDPALRTHMRAELKRLHRRLGASIFHVTHDQVEALTLADRIVALAGGVVQQIGSPRELFDEPANAWVGQFIGSPKMNLLPVISGPSGPVFEGTEQPAPHQPGVDAYQLGVRPSDIRLGSGPLTGVVDVVESLGHEALVHLSLGPHAVRALTPEPTHWRPGDKLALELLKTHPFATQGGVRLRAAP